MLQSRQPGNCGFIRVTPGGLLRLRATVHPLQTMVLRRGVVSEGRVISAVVFCILTWSLVRAYYSKYTVPGTSGIWYEVR